MNKEQAWIVVNIGCIECGVSTNIVGVFNDKDVADQIAAHLNDVLDWREYGQNAYEVFPMPKMNTANDEYRNYLTDIIGGSDD